jgi:hypothetical protein
MTPGADTMARGKSFRIRRLLSYSAGIPPDTRVDPDRFPEDRFPLYCPQCDYLLRGLSCHRCPECGQEFERGRLLVEQYVLEGGRAAWKRTFKYVRWTGAGGFVLGCIPGLLLGLVASGLGWFGVQGPAMLKVMDWFGALIPVLMVVMAIGVALLFASAILLARYALLARAQCVEVYKAIDREAPSFKAARRYRWILGIVFAILCGIPLLFCSPRRSESGELAALFRYYREQPFQAILLLGPVLIVGILLVVAIRLRRRADTHGSEDDQ